MINIAGTIPVKDENYRYKMPPIVPKVEGRGNGIKTVLVNISDVALALNRDASELTKFFGFELGSQNTFSDDGRDIRAVVNGSHSTSDLQTMLTKYIEMFVLCKNCHLPETHYKSKGGVINQKCLACGEKSPCDMTHKLTTFIVKNHKKAKEDENAGKDGKDKKRGEKKDAVSSSATSPASKSTEKKSSRKKEGEEDGDNVAKRNGEENGDDEVEGQECDAINLAIEQFRKWYVNKIQNGSAASTGLVSHESLVVEELRLIQTRLSLRPMDRIMIYMGAVFADEPLLARDQVDEHKAIFLILAPTALQQRHLIASAEWYCGTHRPDMLPFFSVMLRQMYFADIVEEEVVYEWKADHTRNDFTVDSYLITTETLELLRQAAQPFVTWLQEAEEEGASQVAAADEDDI